MAALHADPEEDIGVVDLRVGRFVSLSPLFLLSLSPVFAISPTTISLPSQQRPRSRHPQPNLPLPRPLLRGPHV